MNTWGLSKASSFVLFHVLAVTTISTAEAAPEACSVKVGISVRTGLSYRTWTNALETIKLEDKGLKICQDDGILNVSDAEAAAMDEEKALALLKCNTEFTLELLYYARDSGKDPLTRNLSIYNSRRQALFSRDYPGNPGSLKILKTIPTCAELQAAAAALATRP